MTINNSHMGHFFWMECFDSSWSYYTFFFYLSFIFYTWFWRVFSHCGISAYCSQRLWELLPTLYVSDVQTSRDTENDIHDLFVLLLMLPCGWKHAVQKQMFLFPSLTCQLISTDRLCMWNIMYLTLSQQDVNTRCLKQSHCVFMEHGVEEGVIKDSGRNDFDDCSTLCSVFRSKFIDRWHQFLPALLSVCASS